VDVAGSEESVGMSDVADDEEDVSCEAKRMDAGVSMEEGKVVESDETVLDVGCSLSSGACCDGESSGPLVVGSVLSEMIVDSSSLGC
jgi:hypothetical protein